MVAPTTTAPAESLTTPLIWPPLACDCADAWVAKHPSTRTSRQTINFLEFRLNISFPPKRFVERLVKQDGKKPCKRRFAWLKFRVVFWAGTIARELLVVNLRG